MAVSYVVFVLLFALPYIDVSSGRRYQTLVKSEFPLDHFEQIDRRGSLYRVPLLPAEEDEIRAPDSEYGLKVIKVNRQPIDAEHKTIPSRENNEFTNAQKYREPVKARFTYTPDSLKKDVNAVDEANKLPRTDIKHTSSPTNIKSDILSQKKAEITKPDEELANSAANASSPSNGNGVSSSRKGEQDKKDNSIPEVHLPQFPGYLPHQPYENVFYPHIASNYHLLKHIYDRFLVGGEFPLAQPHRFGPSPNIVNIYYDKRYMQNAPGSHHFVHAIPINTGDHIPQYLPQQLPLVYPGFVHSNQPRFDHHPLPDIQQQPIAYLFHPEAQELELKEPLEFHAAQFDLEGEKEFIDKYFLPKQETVAKFHEKIIPQEVYGLPDTNQHAEFTPVCVSNCPPHVPAGFQFGIPVPKVSQENLPTSYDVPLYKK